MPNKSATNCGDCAYVQKNDGNMWCPFHDLPVSSNLVCDDYLDEYSSPQWKSLADGMTSGEKKIPRCTFADIIMHFLTIVLILFATIFLIFAKP